MDVFSLLNFWRNAGIINTAELDFTSDDSSFFDLVFTNTDDSKSNDAAPVFFKNKRKMDFRVLKLGFQNNNWRSSDKKGEVEVFKSDKFHQTPNSKKDVLHKYLNLIKPFYIKVSGKSPRKDEKPTAVLSKRLRKSRSSAGKLTPSPAARSSDSTLQQDGIQSAILHCKKSYSSPTGCDVLSRSGSAPYQGPRISVEVEELKRSSI